MVLGFQEVEVPSSMVTPQLWGLGYIVYRVMTSYPKWLLTREPYRHGLVFLSFERRLLCNDAGCALGSSVAGRSQSCNGRVLSLEHHLISSTAYPDILLLVYYGWIASGAEDGSSVKTLAKRHHCHTECQPPYGRFITNLR